MKKNVFVLLMVLVMGIFTGCGMTEDEAKEYVEASLDAAYKGNFEAFVEITESTPEGAEAMYEENIVHIMEAAGFGDLDISEELTEKYKQLFLELIKKVDYTVGDAVETDSDSFAVEVMVKPMAILDDLEEELTDALLERIDGLKKHPSDEKIVEMSFEEMYDILSERMKEPVFGEEILVTIHLHKNAEGMYAISEEDMLSLDSALFTIE